VNRAALPLIVLMKYPEPHPGLNPAIQITLRQNLAGTRTQLLEGAVATMRRSFPDLRIIEPSNRPTSPDLRGPGCASPTRFAPTPSPNRSSVGCGWWREAR
jgi:hypothetical protein